MTQNETIALDDYMSAIYFQDLSFPGVKRI